MLDTLKPLAELLSVKHNRLVGKVSQRLTLKGVVESNRRKQSKQRQRGLRRFSPAGRLHRLGEAFVRCGLSRSRSLSASSALSCSTTAEFRLTPTKRKRGRHQRLAIGQHWRHFASVPSLIARQSISPKGSVLDLLISAPARIQLKANSSCQQVKNRPFWELGA